MVNEVRFNYTYGRFTRNFPPGFDAYTGRNLSTELGLPSLTPGGLPEFITGGGNIGWSQSQQNENAEHTFTLANTLSVVRGRQTWKFGVDFLQQRLKTIPMFGASGGRYEFNRNTTLTNSALTNGTGGTPFAQYLLGIYNMATLRDSLIPYYYQWNSWAGFVQNDWQVHPNLTLNLGLRYTLQLPRTERDDRQGAFRPDLAEEFPLAQPVTLPTGEVITTALVPPFAYVGRGGRSRYITPIDWNAWEPRIGFAWVPGFGWNSSEKMVVRGGYGLSHATLTGQGRNPSPDFASGTIAYGFNTRVVDPNFVARICCNKPLWIEKIGRRDAEHSRGRSDVPQRHQRRGRSGLRQRAHAGVAQLEHDDGLPAAVADARRGDVHSAAAASICSCRRPTSTPSRSSSTRPISRAASTRSTTSSIRSAGGT